MLKGDSERAMLFRLRADELRAMARLIAPVVKHDLLQAALEWERLAMVVERPHTGAAP